MGRYATKTKVSSSRSKGEIESVVERYGAQQFMSGWSTDGRALVGFTMCARQVKFLLHLPRSDSEEFTTYVSRGYKRLRTPDSARAQYEQAVRQKWRALALVIKAKLEAVESGISIFEDEFLANIVLPDGTLVGDNIRTQIAYAYETGDKPLLLCSPDEMRD